MKRPDNDKIPTAPIAPLSEERNEEITMPSDKDLEWRAKYAKYGMTEDLVVCDWETWKESEPSSSISTDHS